jgi:hypothetical protein
VYSTGGNGEAWIALRVTIIGSFDQPRVMTVTPRHTVTFARECYGSEEPDLLIGPAQTLVFVHVVPDNGACLPWELEVALD